MSQPVEVKISAAAVDGVHTDIAVLGFANCVVALVTQFSSVGSLIQAVISGVASASNEGSFADPSRFTSPDIPVDVKFVLGNPSTSPVSSLYQLIAIQASQFKHKQNLADSRPLVLGIALKLPRALNISLVNGDGDGEDSVDICKYSPLVNTITELIGECRVW